MIAQMNGWQWLLAVLLILVCCFLMLVVLIQRGRGSGLTGAFGGAGGGSSAFGAKTGDVLTLITVVVAGIFLTLAVVANYKFDESPSPVLAAQPFEVPAEPGLAPEGSGKPINIIPLDGPPPSLDQGAKTDDAGAAEPLPDTAAGQSPDEEPKADPSDNRD